MPIKNNDDVDHLLAATGRSGTQYREFEAASDQMSAPLIDAIFGKDPVRLEREARPLTVGAGADTNLLADVFDREAGTATPKAADYSAPRNEAPRDFSAPSVRASAGNSRAPARSLDDIRRIITQPVERSAPATSTGSLNGLFDRLAR